MLQIFQELAPATLFLRSLNRPERRLWRESNRRTVGRGAENLLMALQKAVVIDVKSC